MDNIDEFEGGFMPYELEDEIDREIREARKEVREECKKRGTSYKFNLPRLQNKKI